LVTGIVLPYLLAGQELVHSLSRINNLRQFLPARVSASALIRIVAYFCVTVKPAFGKWLMMLRLRGKIVRASRIPQKWLFVARFAPSQLCMTGAADFSV
jgi:hypothetical protein